MDLAELGDLLRIKPYREHEGRRDRGEGVAARRNGVVQERGMLEQIGIDIAALQRLIRRYPVGKLDDLDVKALFPCAGCGELDDLRDRTARCAHLQRLGGLA